MFRESTDTRLLVLGRDPDTDLLALLRAWYPEARFSLERGQMSDWLGSLWHQPPSGLVLFADRLDPAEFQALGAWLQERPTLPVLAVMGNRGLFGVEPVLGHAGLRLLPTPWTPQALRQVMGRPSAAEAQAATPSTLELRSASEAEPPTEEADAKSGDSAFAEGFLDGLIERVRDPLASLSGYLQLLQAEQAQDALVRPALEAARELDGVLDSLHLASEACRPHPSRQSGEQLAVQALKDAQKAGHEVEFQLNADFLIHVDPRLVQAALQTARVLVHRFGGGGNLRLRSAGGAQDVSICWDLVGVDDVPEGTAVQVPPFLSMLLSRFAERVDAQVVLDCAEAGVPRRAGLRWQVGASSPTH